MKLTQSNQAIVAFHSFSLMHELLKATVLLALTMHALVPGAALCREREMSPLTRQAPHSCSAMPSIGRWASVAHMLCGGRACQPTRHCMGASQAYAEVPSKAGPILLVTS